MFLSTESVENDLLMTATSEFDVDSMLIKLEFIDSLSVVVDDFFSADFTGFESFGG